MDTSDHIWLEERGPRLCLIGMIDHATSRLLARFVEHDTSQEDLRRLRGWLERYGRPLALYTDRDSIFTTPHSVNRLDEVGARSPTHFAAALDGLGIGWKARRQPGKQQVAARSRQDAPQRVRHDYDRDQRRGERFHAPALGGVEPAERGAAAEREPGEVTHRWQRGEPSPMPA